MIKVEVIYITDTFHPVTYTVDMVRKYEDVISMQSKNSDGSLTESYIPLRNTLLVTITNISNEVKNNESARKK